MLFTEAGGLVAMSSDFLTGRGGKKLADSRLSTKGFVLGGGILMLERSLEALVVSAWAPLRISEFLFAANKE